MEFKQVQKEDEHIYYWVLVVCNNCGLKSSLAFKKGTKVAVNDCPECGCQTLEKTYQN